MKQKVKETLNIENLNVRLKKKNIIKNVNIKIFDGEIVGLVGESGCGKSITALSIIKLIDENVMKITSGKILFNNKNLLSETDHFLRNIRGKEISMIFQEPMTSLNPVFTIGSQINEVLLIHENLGKKVATERTIDLLKKVGIPSPHISINKYPHQLSGGQRQRVMIAMALACSPKLLIADEPTTALDVIVQAQILKIIKSLKKEYNMSVLLITHDLGLVQDFCDRVYVMYDGKIIESAKCRAIFQNPIHQYTKDLLKTRPAANPPGIRLPVIKKKY
tara:strand:+ start:523 stop:1353 length:831 start_codon:yes stop_codon:yes gene_type:complete